MCWLLRCTAGNTLLLIFNDHFKEQFQNCSRNASNLQLEKIKKDDIFSNYQPRTKYSPSGHEMGVIYFVRIFGVPVAVFWSFTKPLRLNEGSWLLNRSDGLRQGQNVTSNDENFCTQLDTEGSAFGPVTLRNDEA
jgi:hypothetical protein